MNLKIPLRLGRILVVLALIVALLGNSIPTPARAAPFASGFFALDATNLIISGARALGIGPGDDPLAFNNLITDAKNSLFSGVTPLVNIWLDYVNNGFRAFLSADFLSNLLSFFFDSGAVSLSPASGFSSYDYGFTLLGSSYQFTQATAPSKIVACFSYESGYPRVEVFYISTVLGAEGYDGRGWRVLSEPCAQGGFYVARSRTSYNYSIDNYLSEHPDYAYYSTSDSVTGRVNDCPFWSGYSSDLDISLDSVSDSLSGSAYTDWSSAAQMIDEQQYFPVSIPSLSDSSAISTQTQAQAQAGTVPDSVADEIIAGSDVVPETGSIADVITAVRALGADIVAAVQAIPAAIADIFSPAADPEVYQVDLKDFFPFCIPFDLFDIVTAFAAEPEAPVFEWPISVPRWGFEYTLNVDLQEWEDVASLFRTLELTIFCVGLAIVTREKFLRS